MAGAEQGEEHGDEHGLSKQASSLITVGFVKTTDGCACRGGNREFHA
jgi:hypothetical protein